MVTFPRRIALLAAIAGLFMVGAATAGVHSWRDARAAVKEECSVATLSGGYGYSVIGELLLGPEGAPQPGGSTRVPVATVGRHQFDGQGGVTAADYASLGGNIVQRTAVGTYSLDSDCRGTMTLTFTPGGRIPLAIVVVDGGEKVNILNIETGTIIYGATEKQ